MSEDLRRRAVLAGVGTALTGAVAGCGGDGTDENGDPPDDGTTPTDNNDDVDEGATDAPAEDDSTMGGDGTSSTDEPADEGATPTHTPPTSKEEMGTLVQDVIGGISLLGWRSEAGGMGVFNVYLNVRNDGSEQLHLDDYTWRVVPFDEDDEAMDVSAAGPIIAEYEEPLAPGESGEASYHVRVDDANAVASYEISLSCDGTSADGPYCPE